MHAGRRRRGIASNHGDAEWVGRLKVEGAAWPRLVVMADVDAEDVLALAPHTPRQQVPVRLTRDCDEAPRDSTTPNARKDTHVQPTATSGRETGQPRRFKLGERRGRDLNSRSA